MNGKSEKIKQFRKLIKAFADQCEDVVYHYTSSNGLKGILENSELWLTNTAFVNDTKECNALREVSIPFTDANITRSEVIDAWNLYLKHSSTNDTYIASFSRGEESLAQWRSYGNFRIGFDAKKLNRDPFNLYQCVYSEKKIIKWISEKSNLKEWQADLLGGTLSRAAAYNLIDAASRKYKSYHFKNEYEVRLVVLSNHSWGAFINSPSMFEDDPPIYYRNYPGYNFPIPYVKFIVTDKNEPPGAQGESSQESPIEMKRRKLKEEQNIPRKLLPITELLVGPMLHQKEAKLACEILLKDKGYMNVVVETSEIPYRGF